MAEIITVTSAAGEVGARLVGAGTTGVLLAHGAGTDQDHPGMVGLRDALADRGLTVMTFNYPYRQRGSSRPDAMPKLLESHRAAADLLAGRVDRMFLAGRSMGGRVATHLLAEGVSSARGAILYAYPLHPAGKEDKLRVDHLAQVKAPMLFFQGTRDPLSRMHLFDRHVRPLPNVHIRIVEGADHGFRVKGREPAEVVVELAGLSVAWIDGVSSGETAGERA